MADPGRGRGRGAALLAMLKRTEESEVGERAAAPESPAADSPHATANVPTPTTPASPSTSSEASDLLKARGRGSLIELVKKMPTSPGSESIASPSPAPSARGAGRASLMNLAQKIGGRGTGDIEPPRPGTSHQQHQQQVAPAPAAASASAPAAAGEKPSIASQLQAMSMTSRSSSDGPISMMGSFGNPIDLMSNYINLSTEPGKGIFRYEVKFEPETDSPSLRNALLNQHLEFLGNTKVFDGVILYIPKKLAHDRTLLESVRNDGTKITLTLLFQRQQRPSESVQFFNTLMNRILKMLKLVRINRNFFNPRTAHKIEQHNMELWPGYVTAIEEMEGGLKLNIDASHRLMRTDTVRDFISDTYKQLRDRGNFKDIIFKELMGLTVLTRYNNKTYRIDDIVWDKNPSLQFSCKGNLISIAEYFKSHWSLTIQDMKQPLILHRQTVRQTQGGSKEEEIYLVPELCYLTGLTDKVRSDFRIMRDLAAVTQVVPDARRNVLRKFIQSVKNEPAAVKLLSDWGIRLEDDIVKLQGRHLPPEKIIFGNDNSASAGDRADWGSAAVRNPVLRTPHMHKWIIVYVQKDERYVTEFCKQLKPICKTMAIEIGNEVRVALRNDSAQSYVTEIRKFINPSLNMVVAISPSQRADRYSAIKKLCCVELPVRSQVIQTRTISNDKKLKSVTEKIALQMNCKLGGALWALQMPFDDIMVVGMDVYHCGPGGSKKSSVAGFVASLDRNMTSWYSKPYFQRAGQEYIDVLKACFTSALVAYKKARQCYPGRIIVYRDGVGDGQLNDIASYEVVQLKAAFALLEPNYDPKLTVIIVQKRINTRFMAMRSRGLENPPPGTIVDSCVTRRNWYDFFLVPQTSKQGTVSPTHYIVLVDEAKFKTDHVQRITYKMCHLYYNWPGTIRVPAPCQYAHKLAYLVGQNIGVEPNECLAESLYYL